MTTEITIALDSLTPADSSTDSRAWAARYARWLAAQLDAELGGRHEVTVGDSNDLPAGYRDTLNRLYDRWCGLSEAEQAAA